MPVDNFQWLSSQVTDEMVNAAVLVIGNNFQCTEAKAVHAAREVIAAMIKVQPGPYVDVVAVPGAIGKIG